MEIIDIEEAKGIIEALLFVANEPLDIKRMAQVLEVEPAIIKRIVSSLIDEYRRRNGGIEIVEIAGGFQMSTKAEYAPWIKRLYGTRRDVRLSGAALETLAIIAYRQPICKVEIEAIRGVNVDGSLKTLLEKRLIKIVGRKKVVGRPLLYGTTKEFLRCFGLGSLKDLPDIDELKGVVSLEEKEVGNL